MCKKHYFQFHSCCPSVLLGKLSRTIPFFLVLWENKFKQEKSETWSLNHLLFCLHSPCSLLFHNSLNETTLSFHPLFILELLYDCGLSPTSSFSYSCWSWFVKGWPKLATTAKFDAVNHRFIVMGNYATSVWNPERLCKKDVSLNLVVWLNVINPDNNWQKSEKEKQELKILSCILMFLVLREIDSWLCVFLVSVFVRPKCCTGIAFHNM